MLVGRILKQFISGPETLKYFSYENPHRIVSTFSAVLSSLASPGLDSAHAVAGLLHWVGVRNPHNNDTVN